MSSVIEPVELEPYPAYRESGLPWIGEVPEHWEVRRFGALAAGFRNGLTVPQLESGVTAHLVSRIETISEGIVDYAKVGYLTGEEDHSPYLLRTDDFLISHINSYAKVGNSARYGGERPLIHGMNLIRVTPLNRVAPAFLGYMLKSELFRGAMQRACKPAINQVSVTTTAIKAIYFPFPPFHEQAAIVRYLDDADRRIRAYVSAKERLIALLEEERQALIHQAVTRGLDPNVKLKSSGVEWLGDVPEHWDQCRLRNVVSRVTTGSRGWSSYGSDTGPLFIRVANLNRGSLELRFDDVLRLNLPETSETGRTRIKPGDLLVSVTAYIGSIGVAPEGFEEAYVSQHVARCEPISGTCSQWLGYVLLSEIGQTHGQMSLYGGTKDGLSLDDVKNYPMLLPPLAEQVATVKYIHKITGDISGAIDHARRQIELMEEYRTRLIADVVTGKIDVTRTQARTGAPGQSPEFQPIKQK